MRKVEIINSLHRVQRNDPLVNEIGGSVGSELDSFDGKIQQWIDNIDIDKASSWALSVYEKHLGIKTNINKSLDDRRAIIKGKLRGTGKVDAVLIEITAESWTNGEVEVGFDGDIVIRFISEIGTPTGIEDLKRVIDEIKPAHLLVRYEYRYITYSEMSNMTYNQLENTIYDEFAWRG